MSSASFSALLLSVALLIPPPGSDSRGRSFCRQWLELSPSARFETLEQADRAELGEASPALACRAATRSHSLARLDYECRNWRLLMDFEVRHFLDASRAHCAKAGQG